MVFFVHKWDPRAAQCGKPSRAFSGQAHENAVCMGANAFIEYAGGGFLVQTDDGFLRNSDGVEFEFTALYLCGRTYSERKESARDLAQSVRRMLYGGMSYAECVFMANWFERVGRKYGLLREFREEGFC